MISLSIKNPIDLSFEILNELHHSRLVVGRGGGDECVTTTFLMLRCPCMLSYNLSGQNVFAGTEVVALTLTCLLPSLLFTSSAMTRVYSGGGTEQINDMRTGSTDLHCSSFPFTVFSCTRRQLSFMRRDYEICNWVRLYLSECQCHWDCTPVSVSLTVP